MTIPTRQDDEFLLAALDMRAEGYSYRDISNHLGRTPSSVSNIIDRVSKANHPACECVKPENKDGGMPEGWWRG